MLPVLSEFPILWRFGVPSALFAGGAYVDRYLDGNYLKTAVLTGTAAVLLFKKFGKILAKGTSCGPVKGWITPDWPVFTISSIKDKILGCCSRGADHSESDLEEQLVEKPTSDGLKNRVVNLRQFELKELPHLPFKITSSIQLTLDYKEGELSYALQIDDKKLEEHLIGELVDDDDDDEEEVDDKPEKREPLAGEEIPTGAPEKKDLGKNQEKGGAEKSEKKPKGPPPAWQKALLLGATGSATAVSTYFLGQGITTEAANAEFSAGAKILLRHDAYLNSYLKLAAPAALLLALKLAFPASFIGDLVFIPTTIAINKFKKELKDMQTGKRAKDMDWYRVPLWLQYYLSKYSSYQVPLPASDPIPFRDVLHKGNNRMTLPIDPQTLDPSKPSVPIDLVLKVGGEKLTGKYMIDQTLQKQLLAQFDIVVKEKKKKKDKAEEKGKSKEVKQEAGKKIEAPKAVKVELHPDLRERLGLSALQPELAPMWREWAFVAASAGATLAASYFTQDISPSSVGDPTRVQAQNMGEGAVTSLLSTIASTYCKQFGKRFSPEMRELGSMGPAIVALIGEQLLMEKKILPFRFAFLFVKIALGIKAMQMKRFMMGKPYTDEEFLTPKVFGKIKKKLNCFSAVPTDDDVQQAIEEAFLEHTGIHSPKDESTEALALKSEVDDSNVISTAVEMGLL